LEAFKNMSNEKIADISKIRVLDHGFVRLVDFMGSDLSIVRAARVSYDAAWRAGEDEGKDAKLIHRLWKDQHTSPFEAVTFTFEVKAPIFVFRQWMRHRTQSYSELSGRYRELPAIYYLPKPKDIGIQSKNNKQGRTITDIDREESILKIDEHCKKAFELYEHLLRDDLPRELARMVLPLNTYSHMFTTLNLLNLFKFLTLRTDLHAQMEIRVYAIAMLNLIRPIVPVAVEAWVDTAIPKKL
jgi:thymidylate synthase (FAD)